MRAPAPARRVHFFVTRQRNEPKKTRPKPQPLIRYVPKGHTSMYLTTSWQLSLWKFPVVVICRGHCALLHFGRSRNSHKKKLRACMPSGCRHPSASPQNDFSARLCRRGGGFESFGRTSSILPTANCQLLTSLLK